MSFRKKVRVSEDNINLEDIDLSRLSKIGRLNIIEKVTTRYNLIFSSIVVFISAFLLGFIVANINNPAGESFADSVPDQDHLSIGPGLEFYNTSGYNKFIMTSNHQQKIYTTITSYVTGE